MSIIEVNNLTKCYNNKVILEKFSLRVNTGEMIAINGCSGKGKSTLLNIIGLIENFDEGELTIAGIEKLRPNTPQAMKVIRDEIGYLFQNFALIDNETVEFNLKIAMKYAGLNNKDKMINMEKVLDKVGLNGYLNRKVYELSGGEQQRVAIARLMLKPCNIILADEPTGSLDEENRDNILNILKYLNKQGKTVIIVTHDETVTNICTRKISL